MTIQELIEHQQSHNYSNYFDHRFYVYCPLCDTETIHEYNNYSSTKVTCQTCGCPH